MNLGDVLRDMLRRRRGETMNFVFATAASTSPLLSGLSNAAGAGAPPLTSRIQPAWRASTAWIASAACEDHVDLIFGAWPL